jgi:hypothetical protein
LIGNDADGRQFKGIVDEIWLNTLAAPADVVAGLTCIRQAPIASLSPAMSPATPPGTPVAFDLSITNPSGASCPADDFQFFGSLPFPLSSQPQFGIVSVAPGQTAHTTVNVTAFDGGASGPIDFQYFVANGTNFSLQTAATATFVIAPPAPPSRTGCAVTPTPPVAPGGYYVNGNTVCTGDGRAHTFHGVDRPSLEWMSTGEHISLSDFQVMATWKPNVVRIALNQDFWLAGSPYFDASYIDTLDNAVAWAEMAGMDVILDLHWSDRGVLGGCNPMNGCQQLMPDANSATFWSQVAAHYKDDGRVMFELYNEPHDVDWNDLAQRRPDVRRLDGRSGCRRSTTSCARRAPRTSSSSAASTGPYDLSGVPGEPDRGPQHRLRRRTRTPTPRVHAPARPTGAARSAS